MRLILMSFWFMSLATVQLAAASDTIPFLKKITAHNLQQQISGSRAKDDLLALTRYHRMRGSEGFKAAATHIKTALDAANLDHVEMLSFPADGEIFYGTQKSRPAWNAKSAELWLMRQDRDALVRERLIARYADNPVILAQDSVSGSAVADLVDVGAGRADSDYQGKRVAGNLVLTSSQPGAVAALAVTKYGAKGIISYAQNQKTAWWQADDRFIRWGHLNSFGEDATFAFMVSLRQARAFQQTLNTGGRVILDAKVDAARSKGSYDIVYARIEGSDAALKNEAIAFSCHLDHQKPGANDNASGCAAILEVARALKESIDKGTLKRPKRSILFFWPPEIEGTIALLNARPDLARSIKSVIHMDMVGGSPATKAIFRVSRGPMSVPTHINDVAEAIAQAVNDQTTRFASGEDVAFPLVAQDGGREALSAITGAFSMGSDHQVYTDSSFGIPSIYLHDWPDRFIHTNFDTASNIDPTKLKRAGFIGAASAVALANWGGNSSADYIGAAKAAILRRTATTSERASKISTREASNLWYYHWQSERASLSASDLAEATDLLTFLEALEKTGSDAVPLAADSENARRRFARQSSLKGPMNAFGYSYLSDKLGAEAAPALRLPRAQNLWGASGAYAYEALNLADGTRTIQEIRNILSAEFGPVDTDMVLEYLEALASISVVEEIPAPEKTRNSEK